MKIVINKTNNRFQLSGPAMTAYLTLGGSIVIERHCPMLVQTVEEMGASANGLGCELEIVEVPSESYVIVQDETGKETVEVKTPEQTPVKNEKPTQSTQEAV
jgi:hypothetical protein